MAILNCPKCSTPFDNYSKWGSKKFCSRKCANSHTPSEKHLKKLSDTISKKTHIKNQFGVHKRKSSLHVVGPYTKVYLCICKYSGKKFYSSTVRTIHPDLARSKNEYTYSCQFRFGISKYPEWFSDATALIKEYGWYSTPGSRNGIKNINGISRDHLYSVTDGWINNVSPDLIRHPANCNLIPHTQNQSKHKKSSITLEELYSRIEKFNSMYGLG